LMASLSVDVERYFSMAYAVTSAPRPKTLVAHAVTSMKKPALFSVWVELSDGVPEKLVERVATGSRKPAHVTSAPPKSPRALVSQLVRKALSAICSGGPDDVICSPVCRAVDSPGVAEVKSSVFRHSDRPLPNQIAPSHKTNKKPAALSTLLSMSKPFPSCLIDALAPGCLRKRRFNQNSLPQ